MSNTWKECAFLIPIERDADLSDGQLHSIEAWEWLDDELFVRFDGVTQAPGLYSGAYRDPDTKERVNDQSRRFIVAIPEEQVEELKAMLRIACEVFQ